MSFKRGLFVLIGAVGSTQAGCQLTSPAGPNVPMPSSGPTLISPGSNASVAPLPAIESTAASPGKTKIGLFGGGQTTPAAIRPSQGGLFRLRLPQSPTPQDKPRSLFQFTSNTSKTSVPITAVQVSSGSASSQLDSWINRPLSPVTSPRKLRHRTIPSGAAEAASQPTAPAVGSPAAGGWSKPKSGAIQRLRRLPPVFESAPGSVKRSSLPQEPIPIYPEVPTRAQLPREDL